MGFRLLEEPLVAKHVTQLTAAAFFSSFIFLFWFFYFVFAGRQSKRIDWECAAADKKEEEEQ